jgi:hypothetical protein
MTVEWFWLNHAFRFCMMTRRSGSRRECSKPSTGYFLQLCLQPRQPGTPFRYLSREAGARTPRLRSRVVAPSTERHAESSDLSQ